MQTFIDYGHSLDSIEAIQLEQFNDSSDLYNFISSKISKNLNDYTEFDILVEGIPLDNYTLEDQSFKTLSVNYTIKGGKGGFGSLLRNAAARKKHFTNFDAAKDMNGRRLRDIKNERSLIEWMKKKKQERNYVDQENEKFNKQEKQKRAQNSFLKIDKAYNEKVQKWVTDINGSVRAGLKKKLLNKREDNEIMIREDEIDDEYEYDEESNKKLGFRIPNKNLAVKKKFKKMNHQKRKNIELFIDNGFRDDIPNGDQLNNSNNGKQSTEKENLDIQKNNEKETENQKNSKKNSKDEIIEEEQNQKDNEEQEEQYTPLYDEIVLNDINSIDDLFKLGMEHLKYELTRLGLKSGGRLEDRAQRLWDIKRNPCLQFDPKYMVKKR